MLEPFNWNCLFKTGQFEKVDAFLTAPMRMQPIFSPDALSQWPSKLHLVAKISRVSSVSCTCNVHSVQTVQSSCHFGTFTTLLRTHYRTHLQRNVPGGDLVSVWSVVAKSEDFAILTST